MTSVPVSVGLEIQTRTNIEQIHAFQSEQFIFENEKSEKLMDTSHTNDDDNPLDVEEMVDSESKKYPDTSESEVSIWILH